MTTLNKTQNTRLAGLFYLLVVLTGIFSLMYVPSQLIDWEDGAATLRNLQSNPFLLRLGTAAALLCYTFFAFLIWSLYRLLQEVNRDAAFIMVLLAASSIPIAVFSIHYPVIILDTLSNEYLLSSLSPEQLEMRVMELFNAYGNGLFVADLFWSSWLFPFGYLVFRSGFLPRFIGILLMVGSVSYFLYFFGQVLLPESAWVGKLRTPASIAEIGTCLWLLIAGAKKGYI